MADKKIPDLAEMTDWARVDEMEVADTSADTSSRIDVRNLVAQAYAGMYCEGGGTTADVVNTGWVTLDSFDASSDTVYNATVDVTTDNDITVDNAGVYEVHFSGTFEWPVAVQNEIYFALGVNGTQDTTIQAQAPHVSGAASNIPIPVSFNVILDLNAGDALSVMVTQNSGTARTLTTTRAYLTVRRIDAAT